MDNDSEASSLSASESDEFYDALSDDAALSDDGGGGIPEADAGGAEREHDGAASALVAGADAVSAQAGAALDASLDAALDTSVCDALDDTTGSALLELDLPVSRADSPATFFSDLDGEQALRAWCPCVLCVRARTGGGGGTAVLGAAGGQR